MIKVIIFDSDGVVINREMYFSDRIARDYNIDPEKIMNFFRGAFKNCLVGRADLKGELKKVIVNWGWKKSVDELLGYWFKSESDINNEVIEVINDCKKKNIACCLATNNEKYRTQYLKDNLGFKNIFAEIFSSSEIGSLKEQSSFWEEIGKILGECENNEVLVIDDEQKNIDAAKNFGFNAEIFKNTESFEKILKFYENN